MINMSNQKNKNKSRLKDFAMVLAIWGPLLFVIIGGMIWRDGGFDGTIMEVLFPALFFGLITGFAALILSSNIFQKQPVLWVIITGVVFTATVALYLLNLTKALTIVIGVSIGLVFLMVLIKWIAG